MYIRDRKIASSTSLLTLTHPSKGLPLRVCRMVRLYVLLLLAFVSYPVASLSVEPKLAAAEQSSEFPPDPEWNTTDCADGMQPVDNDTELCEDIDECALGNDGCSHICVNTLGSYQCQCPPYHRLLEDRKTCKYCKVEILDGHANAGILEPHGYPQPYLGQQDCQWKIKGKPLHVLRLRFDKIDIEYSSCCRNDMLAIKTTSNNYLALVHNLPERICGYYDSLKFYWDGDFTMQFRTSARAVASRHAGFRLHYSYVPVEETSVQELLTRSVSGGYLNHTC